MQDVPLMWLKTLTLLKRQMFLNIEKYNVTTKENIQKPLFSYPRFRKALCI